MVTDSVMITTVVEWTWPKTWYYRSNGYLSSCSNNHRNGDSGYSNTEVAVIGLSMMMFRRCCFSSQICVYCLTNRLPLWLMQLFMSITLLTIWPDLVFSNTFPWCFHATVNRPTVGTMRDGNDWWGGCCGDGMGMGRSSAGKLTNFGVCGVYGDKMLSPCHCLEYTRKRWCFAVVVVVSAEYM